MFYNTTKIQGDTLNPNMQNLQKTFALDLNDSCFDNENCTISFTALSNNPTIKRSGLFGDFYISIDTSAIDFKADTFYLDHNVSFKNAIGKIIDFKRDESGNLKVRVQFFKDIEESQHQNQGEQMSKEVLELQEQLKEVELRKQEEAQILELGQIANASKEALEAIKSGMSYKDFSMSLMREQNFAQKQSPKVAKRDDICFSLANYALSVANGTKVGEVEFKQGHNGLEIPNEYYSRFADEQTRSIDPTSAGFIPEYYRSDKFIESVFVESNILSLCDKMTGLVGTIRVPRDNSSIKAYWVKEGEKTTPSKLGADSITLTPNTIKAKVLITRQMLGMTPFALESYIIREIKRAIRLRLEEDLLYGEKDEDCPISGIFNTAGVQSIQGYFTNTDYKKTLEFGGKLTDANLSIANTHFATNSKGMIHLQSTHYDSENDKYLLDQRPNSLAGYKYFMNNLLKDNHAIFGDFRNVLVGTWGGLQVQALKDDEGDLIFTGFYDVGMELKRPNSFVIAKS